MPTVEGPHRPGRRDPRAETELEDRSNVPASKFRPLRDPGTSRTSVGPSRRPFRSGAVETDWEGPDLDAAGSVSHAMVL